MQYSQTDHGYERIATLAIETPQNTQTVGETLSHGIDVHHRGTSSNEEWYEVSHQNIEFDESGIRTLAPGRLDELYADTFVTYTGRRFDLPFLNERHQAFGFDPVTLPLDAEDNYIDLIEGQKRETTQHEKWPGPAECLESYGLDVPVTIWKGSPVTNTRFGEELGPTYLDSPGEC